eukprot:322936-Hanusia_phi.AAC.2
MSKTCENRVNREVDGGQEEEEDEEEDEEDEASDTRALNWSLRLNCKRDIYQSFRVVDMGSSELSESSDEENYIDQEFLKDIDAKVAGACLS